VESGEKSRCFAAGGCPSQAAIRSMIRKSGHRFSEKIMLKQKGLQHGYSARAIGLV
jgi:hypothetical protein